MKVTVKETSMVQPAECTPRHKLWLSNLDLVQLRHNHMNVIYAYNNTTEGSSNSSSEFFDTKVLKAALSNALVPFYPIAGRLGRDANGRLEVDCNGEGVLFQEAESSETTLAELGEFLTEQGPQIQLTQLVPRVDYSKDVASYPLLILQITRFRCGGVCLGVGGHHAIADGISSLRFLDTWSRMARGLPLADAPVWDRTVLRARQPPTPKFHHIEYEPHPILITNTNHQTSPKRSTTVHVLNLTPDHLKNLIKSHRNSSSSTYEILAAHIWRCASRARGLPDEQPTKLQIAVDGRSRLNPPPPKGYFGNVIFHATPMATVGELVSEPMVKTAERIREAISRMDDEYLRSAIDYLEDPSRPEGGGIVEVPPAACESPNVQVVSWMQLPLNGTADFGWGSSVLFRAQIGEGTGLILPRNGDGSVSLAMCLESDAMEGFRRLLYEFDR